MKAICTVCLTTENDDSHKDPKAYCINGHDSWLEESDTLELWNAITEETGLTLYELMEVGKGKDTTDIKFTSYQMY